MAQNDIQITTTPPLPGLTLVQGVNGALQSLATDFSGAVDPAAIDGVGPYCTWADTGNGLLKRRNAAGTDWVVEGKLLANNSAAGNIDYDNTGSGLSAGNVNGAIDELASEKLDTSSAFGVGQTWQNVFASRSVGVTYTNTTNRPIFISVCYLQNTTNSASLIVDGKTIALGSQASTTGYQQLCAVVLPGGTYSLSGGNGIQSWYELRS